MAKFWSTLKISPQEVLVLKERKCPSHCSGIWKIPTGFIDKSEDFWSRKRSYGRNWDQKLFPGCGCFQAYHNSVKLLEPLLLRVPSCKSFFNFVPLFIRHAHRVIFDNSDVLFICTLKPLSFNISVDDSEIEAARWMPLDEFINQPYHQEDQMCKTIIDICIARYEKCYRGLSAHQVMSNINNRVAYPYFQGTDEEAVGRPRNKLV